jgi:hypothetical protein
MHATRLRPDLVRLNGFNVREAGGQVWQEVFQTVRLGTENDNCNTSVGQILLVFDTLIYGEENANFVGVCLFRWSIHDSSLRQPEKCGEEDFARAPVRGDHAIHGLPKHWGFQSEFCTPAEGHEKGGVEGEGGYFRRGTAGHNSRRQLGS